MQFFDRQRSNDTRVSVLHFTNSTLWGGVEGHICGLLRNFSPRLFRAQLVCDPALYERFRDALPADIAITRLALSSPKHVASALRFARLLRRERPRVVHSHMFWSSLFASPIAWACRVPAIVETLHGTEAWRTGWKASYVLDRAAARFVSRYIAVCDSDARFLKTRKRIPERKISVIHNGVDARRFDVREGARQAIRRSLGFFDTDLVLMAVARFHAGKGHSVLFEAMRQLLRSHPNLKLICLGEGEREPELRGLCEQLGLSACIRFEGYRQNVPEWLAAADINVLPTFYEGFPLTVLEAMGSGLPTVASNVGGIPEAINHGREGLLVPPGDSHKLADAIALLAGNAARRREMGRAARKRLHENFVLEQQVRSTEEMYMDLCGNRTMPEPGLSSAEAGPAYHPASF
ncbi:MAG TPA: glycosyltransferase family 4 protein [Bryobacteraceae bacterium]|nr:glycosyltransferase family 4 protein [Bryobacteraceae bacterium]